MKVAKLEPDSPYADYEENCINAFSRRNHVGCRDQEEHEYEARWNPGLLVSLPHPPRKPIASARGWLGGYGE